MIYTVDEYKSVLAYYQTRNMLQSAMSLIQTIGYNILDEDYNSFYGPDSQKQLFLRLLADVQALINDPNQSLLKSNTEQNIDETTIAFLKSADGTMNWIGTPTNKFEDKHKHILTEQAHRLFVDKLEKGLIEYPPLLLWHEDAWEIGKTDWVAYDDRGFLVAGGTIYKQFESLVSDLQKEPLGMSHRMPMKTVKFEPYKDLQKGEYLTIVEYISNEFTVLPINEAANLLTNWST